MIRLLLVLHPASWRARYGEEFRDLLQAGPLTAAVVLDVLRNAVRQHARARPGRILLLVAALASIPIEVLAVRLGLTDNILWLPSTPARALVLAVLLLAWLPACRVVITRAARRGRRQRDVADW